MKSFRGELHTRSFSLFVGVVLLAACGGPYRIIQQSVPSAFATAPVIGVVFDTSAPAWGGRSEAEWLATQPPSDQASYIDTRVAVQNAYLSRLNNELPNTRFVPSTGSEPVVLVVQPTLWEMGFFRFMVNRDSHLRATISFQVQGQVTDVIEVRAAAAANIQQPAIIQRMSAAIASHS